MQCRTLLVYFATPYRNESVEKLESKQKCKCVRFERIKYNSIRTMDLNESTRRVSPHDATVADAHVSNAKSYILYGFHSMRERERKEKGEKKTRCASTRRIFRMLCARRVYTLIPPYYNFHGGHQSSSFVSADSSVVEFGAHNLLGQNTHEMHTVFCENFSFVHGLQSVRPITKRGRLPPFNQNSYLNSFPARFSLWTWLQPSADTSRHNTHDLSVPRGLASAFHIPYIFFVFFSVFF